MEALDIEQYEQQNIHKGLADFLIAFEGFHKEYVANRRYLQMVTSIFHPDEEMVSPPFQEHYDNLFRTEMRAGKLAVNETLATIGGLEVPVPTKAGYMANVKVTKWHGFNEDLSMQQWSGPSHPQPFPTPTESVLEQLNVLAAKK